MPIPPSTGRLGFLSFVGGAGEGRKIVQCRESGPPCAARIRIQARNGGGRIGFVLLLWRSIGAPSDIVCEPYRWHPHTRRIGTVGSRSTHALSPLPAPPHECVCKPRRAACRRGPARRSSCPPTQRRRAKHAVGPGGVTVCSRCESWREAESRRGASGPSEGN